MDNYILYTIYLNRAFIPNLTNNVSAERKVLVTSPFKNSVFYFLYCILYIIPKRIVAAVHFLAFKWLRFRDDNQEQIIGSTNKRNCLGCVELLSECELTCGLSNDRKDLLHRTLSMSPSVFDIVW